MLRQLPNLLINLLTLGIRIIHPIPDIFLQILIAQMPERQFPIDSILLRRPDHTGRDDDRDVSDSADIGVEPIVADFFFEKGGGEGFSGGVDHVLRYGDGFAEDGAEADAGEDVPIHVSVSCSRSVLV